MKATVVLSDGRTLTNGQSVQESRLDVVGDEVLLWAPGRPDPFGTTAWVPQPAKCRSAVVDNAPNLPLGVPLNGARFDQDGRVILFDENDHHPAHPNLSYEADKFHVIDGGDTAFWKFGLDPEPTQAQREAAFALLSPRLDLFAHPALKRLLSLYTVRPGSSDKPDAVLRDLGWLLTPKCNITRNTSYQIRDLEGWYHWPDYIANSEGHSNWHYESDAHGFAQYLLTGDIVAFHTSMAAVRSKIAFGMMNTTAPRGGCWVKGWWRGEKGVARRGHGGPKWPHATKEWDLGLRLAQILGGGELLRRGVAARDDALLNRDVKLVYNGSGGGRGIGHACDALRYAWLTTGDVRFKDVAEALIDHIFYRLGKLGNPDWFPNTGAPGYNGGAGPYTISAAEETLAHAAIHWWQQHGVATEHRAKLRTMIAWAIEHGGQFMPDGTYRVGYQVTVPAGEPVIVHTAPQLPPQAAMWTRLFVAARDLFGDKYANIEQAAYAGIWSVIPPTITIDYGTWGGSAAKWDAICTGMLYG